MPHAIVADSDDESEEDLLTSSHALETVIERCAGGINMDGATDGMIDAQSTGSTERLRRQILSATEGLMATGRSEPVASKPAASSPASQQARKRRHTDLAGSDARENPPVKRTKRVQTYSSRRTIVEDDDEQAPANPETSQGARFSEHSGVRSSAEQPGGSTQDDFIHHEPNVLFRDTGSTIEDTLSAQQRYLAEAQAILAKDYPATAGSNGNAPMGTGEKPSSSLAGWTASAQTPGGDGKPDGRAENVIMADERTCEAKFDEHADVRRVDDSAGHQSQVDHASNNEDNAGESGKMFQHCTPGVAASSERSQPSPIVEIHPLERTTSIQSTSHDGREKGKKGRRRNSEPANPDSEPLHSDDKAIGLPKERYVPRPSRRRATAVVEEAIDYGMIPEKAAKMKRTRTTATAATGATLTTSTADVDSLTRGVTDPTADSDHDTVQKASGAGASTDAVDTDILTTSTKQTESESPVKPSQTESSTGIPVNPDHQDKIFVKPALPTPKPKASAKSRRSHTTIFEDHIEFIGSQRSSPSLSQQQAKRKSALKASNESKENAAQRKWKTIVVDDDDDDDDADELAMVNDPDDEPLPPKKRGRGRPPKSAPKPQVQAKSAETVVDDSDEENNGRNSEVEDAQTKTKRGRPAKAKPTTLSQSTASDKENEATEPDEPAQTSSTSEPSAKTSANSTEHAPLPAPSAQENPTPSPDKQPEKPAPTPPQKTTKPDPNSHSPIKSSSAVPHRVGLSRRHKIPSLLRTMKPPKR